MKWPTRMALPAMSCNRRLPALAFIAFAMISSVACAQEPRATHRYAMAKPFLGLPLTDATGLPAQLSSTGAFSDCVNLVPNPSLIPYDINYAFWSDGASKHRWLALPTDQSAERPLPIRFTNEGIAQLPRGSVLVKHFEKQGRRLETRLLFYLGDARVFGGSYRWRSDQRDADLVTAAAVEQFTGDRSGQSWDWYFPSPDDCTKCHTQRAGGILGLSTAQLNRQVTLPEKGAISQLDYWRQLGLIDSTSPVQDFVAAEKLPGDSDTGVDPELRLRAYLHVNCGNCHQPGGVAADFDVRFGNARALSDLIGRPARINFGIDRARLVAPNDAWRSLMLVRMKTLQPTKMPPLAHQSLDRAGIALMEEWIGGLPGAPVVAPPTAEPSGQNFSPAIRVKLSHADPQATIRYTLDGLPPTSSSPVYTQPLELENSVTVRARAFREGWTRSITVNHTYIRE